MTNEQKQKTADIINPGLGDIEKVREILFGKYVSSFDQRFADLEARLEADVDKLKDRLVEKIATIEETLNASLHQVQQSLQEEELLRDKQLRNLESSLTEAQSQLSTSINLMEDQAHQEISSLQQSLAAAQEELTEQAQAASNNLLTLLNEQSNALEQDKVSRQSLALMLDEVAVKLRSN